MVTMIGNGNNTPLWLDKWHPKGILMKEYGEQIKYDMASHRLTSVASILQNGEWCPSRAISHVFTDVCSDLHAMEKLNSEDEDVVVWTGESNGIFSTKSAWLCQDNQCQGGLA